MSRDDNLSTTAHRWPSAARREAQKAFKQHDANKALSEYGEAEKAFFKNRDRLKAERRA